MHQSKQNQNHFPYKRLQMNHINSMRNKLRGQRGAGPLIIVLVVLALVVGLVAYLYSSGSLNLAFGNNKRAETFADALKTYGGHGETAVANLTSKGYDIEGISAAFAPGGLASDESDVKLDARTMNKAMFDKLVLPGGPASLTQQNFIFRVKKTAMPGGNAPYRLFYVVAIPYISADVCRALPEAQIGGQSGPISGDFMTYFSQGNYNNTPAAFVDTTAIPNMTPNKSGCMKFANGDKVYLHTVANVESE